MIDILRNQIKTILFLSSYTFLFIIFIIRNFQNLNLVYFLSALIILSNLIMFIVIKRCCSLADEFIKVKKIENKNSINATYLVTHIIPFLSIDFFKISDIVSLTLLFLVIGFLYIKSDMIYVNPMLNFFHYNLLEIKTSDDKTVIVITKHKNKSDIQKTKFRKITDSILVG